MLKSLTKDLYSHKHIDKYNKKFYWTYWKCFFIGQKKRNLYISIMEKSCDDFSLIKISSVTFFLFFSVDEKKNFMCGKIGFGFTPLANGTNFTRRVTLFVPNGSCLDYKNITVLSPYFACKKYRNYLQYESRRAIDLFTQ